MNVTSRSWRVAQAPGLVFRVPHSSPVFGKGAGILTARSSNNRWSAHRFDFRAGGAAFGTIRVNGYLYRVAGGPGSGVWFSGCPTLEF